MKTVEITNKSSLQNVLTETTGEDVLVMRDGHAVALVTPFDDDDVEWYVREREPEFIASIERARAQAARGETFSFDDLDALLVDRVDGLDLTSFSVPVSVQTLQRTQCKSVITEPGVYVVLRPNREHPVFLPQSVGGKKSGQDLSYPLEVVSRKWIAEATILYTGMTSDVGGLRARLKSYMNFGFGKSTSHRGGRLIWQLQNHRQLFIRWLAIPSGHPEEVEKEILQHFRRERGELPFANFKC